MIISFSVNCPCGEHDSSSQKSIYKSVPMTQRWCPQIAGRVPWKWMEAFPLLGIPLAWILCFLRVRTLSFIFITFSLSAVTTVISGTQIGQLIDLAPCVIDPWEQWLCETHLYILSYTHSWLKECGLDKRTALYLVNECCVPHRISAFHELCGLVDKVVYYYHHSIDEKTKI